MKLLMSLMFILFFLKKNKLNLLMLLLSIMMLMMFSKINLKTNMLNDYIMMDNLSLIMMLLTMISVMLISLSSFSLINISMTLFPILLILLTIFVSKNMLMFYITFETVLIPTIIMITMNGKQPERLQASIYLLIYMLVGSLPLLMSIIFSKENMSFLMINILTKKFSMILFLMMAFLIKMPMYLMHLWLPKAHVEAPLEGSMILAAILLKLGGYGIIRFMPMCISSMSKLNNWIISISLIGVTITSMNCIRQKDLKSLIAYSSVAHMGFVLMSLFTMNYIGLNGAIMMMIAHGLTSSALFLLANDLYIKYHSRNILMFKGMFTLMPNITFWWFMFMTLNISAPPTINTLSEIMMMSSIILWNYNLMMLLFMMSIMVASFSLMMFINIIHNKNELFPSMNTCHKIYLSLFMHLIPNFIMISKTEIMFMY